MSGDNRNVGVTLNADVSGYQRALDTAARSTTVLIGATATLAKTFDNIIQKTGRGLVLFGTGGIAGLTAAAEAANRLDQSFAGVRSTSILTGQSLGQLERAAFSLAGRVPMSTAAIAELMGQIQSLGVQGTANITRFTEVAIRLGAATNTPPGQLIGGLIELSRTMGSSFQDVERYSSALVSLSKNFGVSAQGIVDFSTAIEGVATRAGYTQAQVMGLATAFNRVGAEGGSAATAFVRITSDITTAIATGSSQLNTYANLVGQTREEFTKMAQTDPASTFIRVIEAIRDQGPRGVLVLQQLGLDGVRLQRVIASLSSGQANLRQTLGESNRAFTESSALTKSSNAAWEQLSTTFTKFRSEAGQIVTTFGGPMARVINVVVGAATKMMDIFNNLPAPIKTTLAVLATIGAIMTTATGALTLTTLALVKFASVWGLLNSRTTASVFQGFRDGLKGLEPRDIEARSRAMQGLYRTAYRGGSALHRDGDGPNILQRAARAPVRFAQWQLREAREVLRHPIDPFSRDMSKTSPLSAQGMFHRAKTGLSEALDESSGLIGRMMSSVQTAYATALQKIVSLAQAARAQLSDLNRDASSVAFESALNKAKTPTDVQKPSTMTGEADEAVKRAEERVDHVSSAAARKAAILKVDADTASAQAKISALDKAVSKPAIKRVIVDPVGSGSLTPTSIPGIADDLAGGGRWARFRSMGSAAAGAVSSAGNTLMGIAGTAMPYIALGTAAWGAVKAIEAMAKAGHKAAVEMKDLGADVAQAIGQQYHKPTMAAPNPADRTTPFSETERVASSTSSFGEAYSTSLRALKDAGKNFADQVNVAQSIVTNMVQNVNQGASLNDQQQRAIREMLIRSYGMQQAQSVYGQLNLTGQVSRDQAQTSLAMVKAARSNEGFWDNGAFTGRAPQRQLRAATEGTANAILGGNFQQVGLNLATLAKGLDLKKVDPSRPEMTNADTARFQQSLRLIQDQVNKDIKDKDAKIDFGQVYAIDSLQDVVDALDKGGTGSRRLADELRRAGLEATDLDASIERMSGKLQEAARNAQVVRMSSTEVGKASTRLGADVSNPQDIRYNINVAAVNQEIMRASAPGQLGDFNITALNAAIDAWEKYKAAIGSPTDPAYQAAQSNIDALNQKLQTQMGLYQNVFQQSSVGTIGLQSSVTAYGADPLMADDLQAGINQQEQLLAQSISQLRQYVIQVEGINRQRRYAEQDHQRQLAQMQRDFALSMEEAYYQEGKRKQNALYEYNEQVRSMTKQTSMAFNPLAQVQSQYTMGADAALLNANEQNKYLAQTDQGLNRLRKMGVSNDVIAALGLDDPKNFEQLNRFVQDLAANPKLVDQWNSSIKNRLSLSEAIAVDPSNEKMAELRRSFEHSADVAEEAFNHAMSNARSSYQRTLGDFQNSYRIAGARTTDNLKQIGENLYDGLDKILEGAKKSGNTHLAQYAQSIIGTIGRLRNVIDAFVKNAQNLAGNTAEGWWEKLGFRTPGEARKAGYTPADANDYAASSNDMNQAIQNSNVQTMNVSTLNVAGGLAAHAAGGVVTRAHLAMVGERGPEMVLPLNGSGVDYLANVMSRMSELKGSRVSGYRQLPTGGSITHVDASTNFTGPITVQAQDPNEMQRKLDARKRLNALRRPVGGRV